MKPRFWDELCNYLGAAALVLTVLSWCRCSEPPLKRPPKKAEACRCVECVR